MKEADSSERPSVVTGLQPDLREQLVERVAASSAFGKSNRLRDLFLFLCHRKVTDPAVNVREQEIGIEVFGRHPDYDTTQDAIVRVQVSQLRKRLDQYFATEGHDEPVVIEVPKGSYTPVFHSRDSEALHDDHHSPEFLRQMAPHRSRRRLVLISSVTAVCVLAVALLLFGPWRSGSLLRAPHNADSGATLDRLWDQMFDNGRPTCIVVSDAMLGLFEDAIKHQLTLNEYRGKEFTRLSDESLKDPVERTRWKEQIGAFFTHISDARSAAMFSVLSSSRNLPSEIIFAGDFAVSYLDSHNLIFVGTRRTNPWVELFEDQLNFRSVFLETRPMTSYFENRSPLAGESATYAVRWTKQGYCRVAFIPNPSRRGNALLITGTDMASSEAGSQFITSERWMQTLSSALGMKGKTRFPYFEVLLRVDYMTWNTPKFELVAQRVHKF